jgi:hypothetical protein
MALVMMTGVVSARGNEAAEATVAKAARRVRNCMAFDIDFI